MGHNIQDHGETQLEADSNSHGSGITSRPDDTASEFNAEGTLAATIQNQVSDAGAPGSEFSSQGPSDVSSGSSEHNKSAVKRKRHMPESPELGIHSDAGCCIEYRDQECTDQELQIVAAAPPVKPEYKDPEKRLDSMGRSSLSPEAAKKFADGGFYALDFGPPGQEAWTLSLFGHKMWTCMMMPSKISLPSLKEHRNDCCFHHVVSQGLGVDASQYQNPQDNSEQTRSISVCQRCRRHLPCTKLLYLFCSHICCVCLECALYSPPRCSEVAAAQQSLAVDRRMAMSPLGTVSQKKDEPSCSRGHNLSSSDSTQSPLAGNLQASAAAMVEQRGISCAQCGGPAQYIKRVKYTL